jgi:transaldolase
MNERLQKLHDAGVSIWLDDLSRERLDSGNLVTLITDSSVTGVTTNPTIFASALSKGEAYDVQLKDLAADGTTVPEAITTITTTDVRNACDVFADTYTATGGLDGRVSLEVSPKLALDTDGTIAEARELWSTVDRPNLLIKIPATKQGLPAIATAISEGISVNVTLIFGLGQYADVMEAYLSGLERAADTGHDVATIHSVASFFVSRVDTEYDKRLTAIGTDEAKALRSKAAIANARLAYQLFEQTFAGERWEALAAKGANKQRPLWASTGVKDPNLPDTLYVTELVVADTVNTMPEKTMQAFADHGEVEGDKVTTRYADAQQTMDALAGLGIDYDEVIDVLESEGVSKFMASWDELTDTVQTSLREVESGAGA